MRKNLLVLLAFCAAIVASRADGQPLRGRSGGNSPFVAEVNQLGAIPNDSGDDTRAFQSALDAVHAAGGGTVRVSAPGTYYLTNLYTSAGGSPTSPNTTLNAALVVYSDTSIVCAPGVTITLGITKDSARCYMLRNADPTNGNSNITIDGGFWNGGGVVAEAASPSGTTFTITGDYRSRFTSGTTFYVSDNTHGKTAFTASIDATYSAPSTTITVASGAYAGGLQSSWQAANAQSPAVASINGGTDTITITGDYRAYGSIGSTLFLYGNGNAASNKLYTIATIDYSNPTTTITTSTDIPAGVDTVTKGNAAFIYNAVWYADAIRLQNVSGLTVRNTKGGGVDKYVWHVVSCNRVLFDNNTFENGSDGVHLAGGNVNVAIRNTYGRTLDNTVAVVTDEKWYRPAQTDIAGNCSNILVDGVFLDASKTCFEPFRATGTSSYTIDGLTVRNLYGTVGAGYGVRFADDTAAGYGLLVGCVMRRVLVENVNLVVPSGYAQVYVGAYGLKDLTCRNLNTNLATNQAVLITTPSSDTSAVNPESVVIDGITTGVATTTKLVQVDAIVDKLTIANMNVKLGVSGVGIQASNTSATEGRIKDGNLTNSVIEAANGSGSSQAALFLNTTAAMKSRLNFSNVSMRQTNGAGTFNPIQASGYCESAWNGVDISGTSGTCYLYPSAAGAVMRIDGGNCKVTLDGTNYNNATNFIFGTSGAMSINNPTIPVGFGASNGFAARVASAQTGDMIYNTSAFSTTSGQECVGPGLYRYTGVFWEYVGPRTIVARTADTTLVNKHTGNVCYTNSGAAGTITITLPAATVGMQLKVTRAAAQTLRVDPSGTETIALPSTGVQGAAGKYLSMDSTGATLNLVCNAAGTWSVAGYSGTFAAEP